MIEHVANQLNLIIRNPVIENHFQEDGQKRWTTHLSNGFYGFVNFRMGRNRHVSGRFRSCEPKYQCLFFFIFVGWFHSEVDNML
jgi:hypothetical protein